MKDPPVARSALEARLAVSILLARPPSPQGGVWGLLGAGGGVGGWGLALLSANTSVLEACAAPDPDPASCPGVHFCPHHPLERSQPCAVALGLQALVALV